MTISDLVHDPDWKKNMIVSSKKRKLTEVHHISIYLIFLELHHAFKLQSRNILSLPNTTPARAAMQWKHMPWRPVWVEFVGDKKFHQLTCCNDGILLQKLFRTNHCFTKAFKGRLYD